MNTTMSTKTRKSTSSTHTNSKWEAMKEDIRRIYLTEQKTLFETRKEIDHIYNFSASERTWKYHLDEWHFNKKLTQEEKAFVLSKAQKRHLEDKETIFYHRGVLLDTNKIERLKRQRISEECDIGPLAAALGQDDAVSQIFIGASDVQCNDFLSESARISVMGDGVDQEPGPAPQDCGTEHLVDIDTRGWTPPSDGSPIVFGPEASFLFASSPSLNYVSLGTPRMAASDCGSLFDKDFDSEYYHELFSWTLGTAYPEPSLQRNSETRRELSVALPGSFGTEEFSYLNLMYKLVENLPWFQFQELVNRYGINIDFVSALRFGEVSSTRPPRLSGALGLVEMCQALDARYKIVSGLLDVGLNDSIQDYIDKLTNQLLQLIPEKSSGEIKTKVHHTFNEINKFPAFQIFEWALYLSSNNLLSKDNTDNLLAWIVEERLIGPLISLLEQQSPTLVAFAARIVESAVRIRKPAVLSQLLESSIDSRAYRGPQGAILLHDLLIGYCWDRKGADPETFFELVRILLVNGAHPDMSNSYWTDDNALFYAALNRDSGMVKLLAKFGANVNAVSDSRLHKNTALACAVESEDITSINMLLDLGAEVDQSRMGKLSTLEWAAMRSSSIYEILLKRSSLSEEVVNVAGFLHAAKQSTLSSYSKQSEGFLNREIRKYMESALMQAVGYSDETDENCSYTVTKTLLEFGVNPNTPTQIPENPLKTAFSYENMRTIKLLLSAGASVNAPGVLSAVSRNFKLLDFLIDSGADINTPESDALHTAAGNGSLECVALLLRSGVDVNSRFQGQTPLQYAAQSTSVKVAQMLVEHGAEVNTPSEIHTDITALGLAAHSGCYDMVEYLLDMGAYADAEPREVHGITVLEAAAGIGGGLSGSREEHILIFKLLLSKGALFNRRGPDDVEAIRPTTVLHKLIYSGENELCCLAVAEGADVNYMTSGGSRGGGRTPLQLAAEEGRLEIVKLLLTHGAQVNAPPAPRFGRTALQAAAFRYSPALDIIQILLEEGAEVNAEPAIEGGVTAIQGAAIRGHINVALALLKAHARVNDPPAIKDGRTAVEGAAEHGRLDMVKLLLEAGAVGDPDTGFERAVKAAEAHGHFAVADILREHMQRQAA
ncbi:ankyrin repeat protein [Rutstroemia sp. NJR-2017a BVV2]|nr:ankyrin repeat protein [Rutstroemia sp. NJR-2017a BVV2]